MEDQDYAQYDNYEEYDEKPCSVCVVPGEERDGYQVQYLLSQEGFLSPVSSEYCLVS